MTVKKLVERTQCSAPRTEITRNRVERAGWKRPSRRRIKNSQHSRGEGRQTHQHAEQKDAFTGAEFLRRKSLQAQPSSVVKQGSDDHEDAVNQAGYQPRAKSDPAPHRRVFRGLPRSRNVTLRDFSIDLGGINDGRNSQGPATAGRADNRLPQVIGNDPGRDAGYGRWRLLQDRLALNAFPCVVVIRRATLRAIHVSSIPSGETNHQPCYRCCLHADGAEQLSLTPARSQSIGGLCSFAGIPFSCRMTPVWSVK